ncbi:MAG: NAD-dependent epimerase/dehydratase family protein [Acidimicrobiia bacterium]
MKRVLVTGMGGELGTRVAQLLEARPEVGEIAGVDFVPPRRRLRRSAFRRIDPRDRDKLVDFVIEFAPTAIVHFGVYEPDARMGPRDAGISTTACTLAAFGAAARTGTLERLVIRSGIEVYGRGGGRPLVPDEESPLAPTTPFGRTCIEVESSGVALGRRHDVTVSAVRMAPVVGSHAPSPLGRLLRLPAVPVPMLDDPPFSLVHPDDAARAAVEALCRGHEGPLNVVGPGAGSPWQVVRLGGRIPVPVLGPMWAAARRVAELAGAPVPPHVVETMCKGCAADGRRAIEELELTGIRPTQQICAELYEWATVTPIHASEAVA